MDHHSRINLNLRDVKHLQTQFAKDATEKLNLYLPTTDSSDPLKSRVSSLVNQFIYEIFERARESLDIDGDQQSSSLRTLLENPTNEVEPFDFSLQEQVRKLYQEVEEETIKLTKLRRETPQDLKWTYEQSFEKSFGILELLQKEIEEMAQNEEDKESDVSLAAREVKFTAEVKPRLVEMAKEYEHSLRALKNIKDDIPQERGELEKLHQITKFLSEKS